MENNPEGRGNRSSLPLDKENRHDHPRRPCRRSRRRRSDIRFRHRDRRGRLCRGGAGGHHAAGSGNGAAASARTFAAAAAPAVQRHQRPLRLHAPLQPAAGAGPGASARPAADRRGGGVHPGHQRRRALPARRDPARRRRTFSANDDQRHPLDFPVDGRPLGRAGHARRPREVRRADLVSTAPPMRSRTRS